MNIKDKISEAINWFKEKKRRREMEHIQDNMQEQINEVLQESQEQEEIIAEDENWEQWYKKHRTRYLLEEAALKERYPDAQIIVLNDARLCFNCTIHNNDLSAICGYNHPIPLPEFYSLSEKKFSFTDDDGKVDIFKIDDSLIWDPNNLLIADIFERLEMVIKLEEMIKKGTEITEDNEVYEENEEYEEDKDREESEINHQRL